LKKYLVSIAVLGLLAACGGSSNSSTETKDTATAATTSAGSSDLSSNPDYKAGLALIAQNDCLTCHKVSEKVVGPAYADVAAKYAGQDTAVTYLAHKVIAGGSGVWGNLPMSAHPQLSEADAEQMVKYVLLLKK
jgi:cytochrome c